MTDGHLYCPLTIMICKVFHICHLIIPPHNNVSRLSFIIIPILYGRKFRMRETRHVAQMEQTLVVSVELDSRSSDSKSCAPRR